MNKVADALESGQETTSDPVGKLLDDVTLLVNKRAASDEQRRKSLAGQG